VSNRGNRKYRCADCGADRMVHWVERNRASRPRCLACGSQRLDPQSVAARGDELIGRRNVAQHDPTRGGVVRS
jgi:DNA-directed RNA polymerase subunit RPC12/RpoP